MADSVTVDTGENTLLNLQISVLPAKIKALQWTVIETPYKYTFSDLKESLCNDSDALFPRHYLSNALPQKNEIDHVVYTVYTNAQASERSVGLKVPGNVLIRKAMPSGNFLDVSLYLNVPQTATGSGQTTCKSAFDKMMKAASAASFSMKKYPQMHYTSRPGKTCLDIESDTSMAGSTSTDCDQSQSKKHRRMDWVLFDDFVELLNKQEAYFSSDVSLGIGTKFVRTRSKIIFQLLPYFGKFVHERISLPDLFIKAFLPDPNDLESQRCNRPNLHRHSLQQLD
ncbi:hypothetical protein SNE40_014235 [Patella caerulea]|uniref:Uncharacterized protein n=1 Tax=Patella caerulea TaxID=87958 RepID=A0AAN8JFA1_PATCE